MDMNNYDTMDMDNYNTQLLIDNCDTDELIYLTNIYYSIYKALKNCKNSNEMLAEVLAEVQEIIANEQDNAPKVMDELVRTCIQEITGCY